MSLRSLGIALGSAFVLAVAGLALLGPDAKRPDETPADRLRAEEVPSAAVGDPSQPGGTGGALSSSIAPAGLAPGPGPKAGSIHPQAALRALARARGPAPGRTPRSRRPDPRALRSMLHARMLEPIAEPLELGAVVHSSFRTSKHGLPVFNRVSRLHEREGRPFAQTGRSTIPPLAPGAVRISREAALAIARDAAPGRGERSSPRIERGWLALSHATVPVWRTTLPIAEPLSTWRISVDARDGSVVEREDLVRTASGSGLVYPENVATTPAPLAAPLYELDGLGFLRGRFTQVFDVRDIEAFRPDLSFVYPESDPRFAQTSVYRGLTDAALFAESHGLPAQSERVLAFINLYGGPAGEQYNNAYYDPFFPIFGFGNGDGVITSNLSTDVDVAIHEMGHHVFASLVDPTGSSSLGSLDGINEGFADTLAAFVNDDPEIGESTIPGQPHLRTLLNDAVWPDDAALDPHVEGLIFSGLHWDLRTVLGVDLAADIVLGALPFLDPDSDFPAHAYHDALVQGEFVVSGGANRAVVESLAEERGLHGEDTLGVEGFLEEGIAVQGALQDGAYHLYLFSEFPDSRQLTIRMTGSGNADLLVAPDAIYDPDVLGTYFFPGLSTSQETVTVTQSSNPSVDADDFWLVAVFDYPNGLPSTYRVTVTSILPLAGIQTGGSYTGSLDDAGHFELLTFQGFAGQIVRLEAHALDPELDVAVSVFDPSPFEILGSDDDSGPGNDALIQGAQLSATKLHAIAVYSLIADVDPTVGGGDFRLDLSLCTNTGPDSDGDGLADVCDDDDDDDGFKDASDRDPLDEFSCNDMEGDGCDDCVGGSFAPFDDGPNADGDHLCDEGDPDDDNDGCEDEIDVAPLTPSLDDDLDHVGADCDNCPDDHNPGQLDNDEDGLGNPCDPTPNPEPAAGILALAALLSLAGLRSVRRRRTKAA